METAVQLSDLSTTVDPQPKRWARRALDIMLEVTDSITSADGVDSALNRLARLAVRGTGADRCAIFVRDPLDRSTLIPAAGASRLGDLAELRARFESMEPIHLPDSIEVERFWGPDSVVTLDNASSSPWIPESWKDTWRLRSVAIARLKAGGEEFGLLGVDYVQRPHTFTKDERELLGAIAAAAGVALRSARLVERLQKVLAVERRLSECGAALRSGSTLTQILDVVADRFASLLPETSCSIWLVSADGKSLRPAAFRGVVPPGEIRIDDLPIADVRGVRRVWARDPQAPIVVPQVQRNEGLDAFIPPGIGTGMLLPLPVENEPLGFVAVGRASGVFVDAEVRVARAFADQAALALTQARLTETLQVRLRLIEALFSLSGTVTRTSDVKGALTTLNQGVCAEIGVRCSRISFGDPAVAKLVGAPVATVPERALIQRWRHEDEPEPVVLGDSLAVPVPLEHRPAGVLQIQPSSLPDRTALEVVRAIAAGIGEIAYKAKLRRTGEQRAQELAIAAERERIARDLHDTVGQTLYGIGLKLQDVILGSEDPVLTSKLTGLRALAAQGVADVRSAVYALAFLHVRARGLVASLRALGRQFKLLTGIDVQVRVRGKLPGLPEEQESALYRVAHEALVNVERHARATGVVLSLDCRSDAIELVVRDDGVGLGQRDGGDWRSSAHFGMRTMARSLEQAGGRFSVAEASPRGLIITGVLPLKRGHR